MNSDLKRIKEVINVSIWGKIPRL